jgi:elongation factor 1-gamma
VCAQVLDPAFRAPYVNVNRYVVTMHNQPHFKAVLGEVTLCEKMQVYTPKEEVKAAAPAPAAAAPAASPAKDAKKAKKDDEEEEEEEYDEKPKEKNPLDLLPPSTFNLEAWKRFYSNNEEAYVPAPMCRAVVE